MPGPNTGINPFATYNTGYSSGMNHGTTTGGIFTSGSQSAAGGGTVAGTANVSAAVLVGAALVLLLSLHLLGFRFAFDVSVGRR